MSTNNFGFSFGVPLPSEQEGGDDQAQTQSQDYSIDLSQITPPTFRFGQFGQAPLPDDDANANSNVDNDSFLAEPSISVGQFDASFNFAAHSSSQESLPKSTSTTSVPILIEEAFTQPDYLEEPAPHSVEDLFKATVDGSTKEIVLDESWENVGIEEIEAAQAEFDLMKQEEAESEASEKKVTVVEEDVQVDEEETHVHVTDDTPEELINEVPVAVTKSKPKASPKKTPAAPKPKAKPKAKVEAPVIVSEGRSKRERKTVKRLAETVEPKVSKASVDKTPSIPKGTGIKLGDIEVVEKNLNKKLSSDKQISTLHRIVFDRVGEARTRKSNLRSFCGLESTDNMAHFEAKLQKLTVADLKELAQLLGLTGASDKTGLVSKISAFLVKPNKESVKAEKTPVKKSATSKKAAPAKKRATTATPKSPKKSKTAKVLTPEIIDSDVESDIEREVLSELNNSEEN